MKKKILALGMAIMLLASQVNLFAKTEVKQVKLRNRSCNVITVTADDTTAFKVVKPNMKQVGVTNFKNYIASYKPRAAINANYFEAYKGGYYPYGTQMTEGTMINMSGDHASLLVFDKNKFKIVQGFLRYNGFLDGLRENDWTIPNKANTFEIWDVNGNLTSEKGAYVYNSYRNATTKFGGGTVIEVVDNKVSKVYKSSENMVLPKNGYIIYYGKEACDDKYIDDRFKIGRTVEFELVLSKKTKDGFVTETDFDYNGEKIPYTKVSEIISAGPLLVENSNSVYETYVNGMEAKMTTGAGARTLIGINKSNQLVMVTTSGTMAQVKCIMQDLGCTDAFNLDGGASSAMYANGKYYRNAGRALNTVFLVQDVKPEKKK
ncbi:phosphodiester glycosidase family protein [Fenollaria timonensis]|uniref:phosphodiester glycosidase family protein n=1 Tax=Fenollaria timonensis TaxID=1723384 RepID=UPI0026ECD9F5|nr:phosphodiester glycosidase family protein [Fenollaria timonensis]